MFVIICGIASILIAVALGWETLNEGTEHGTFVYITDIVVTIAFALFGGFLIGTKISDNVAGVEEFKAEDYYLDYRINLTQVNGKIVGRDTTYVLTRKD